MQRLLILVSMKWSVVYCGSLTTGEQTKDSRIKTTYTSGLIGCSARLDSRGSVCTSLLLCKDDLSVLEHSSITL